MSQLQQNHHLCDLILDHRPGTQIFGETRIILKDADVNGLDLPFRPTVHNIRVECTKFPLSRAPCAQESEWQHIYTAQRNPAMSYY